MKKILAILLLATSSLAGSSYADDETIKISDEPDPFQQEMGQHFKSMIGTFFNQAFQDQGNSASGFIPVSQIGSVGVSRADMYETAKDIIVTVDMPGIRKKDVDIEILPGKLNIKYEQKAEKKNESKDKNYVIAERRYSSFSRQFNLPYYAKIDEAKADYKDGVINITTPKDERINSKPRKIEVR